MFKWLPFADLLLKKLMTVVIADLVAMQLNLKKRIFAVPLMVASTTSSSTVTGYSKYL